MGNYEVKEMLERMDKAMEVATARGRAKKNGRAISLEPMRHEVEHSTRSRSARYIEMARDLSAMVRSYRHGVTKEELEKVEFVREQLYDIAKSIELELIERG